MKNFKEYLAESTKEKKHDFRVKVAGDFTAEQESKLKSMLERFQVSGFKKVGTTPIQQFPLDFPQVRNCDVKIFEVTLDYPTTQQELTEYLAFGLGVSKQRLVVRRPGEPSEEYQEVAEKREGALLNDPDYKESPNANFEDFYGTKYNSGFVKELNDLLKLERKARGEVIPTEGAAKFNVDSTENSKSVLQSAPDPRK
jgi:hypothetical protein